jgi:anti-sigma B factor antagonist
MESPTFTIEETVSSNVHILQLHGYLDASTSHILDDAIQSIIQSSNRRILIDCENLTYISSAGLGIFMKHVDAIRSGPGDIVFCSMQKPVFNVFDLLGFPVLFRICNDKYEGLQYLTHEG